MISICRNNPVDLEVTLSSVSMQSVELSRHIVIDGSDGNFRHRMEEIAQSFSVDYVWSPPQGIYVAMARGLDVIDPTHFVWFLNATDQLASSHSVQQAVAAISEDQTDSNKVWFVGQTYVYSDFPHLLRWPGSCTNFVAELRQGKLGLPHSSTIVRADALRKVEAFEGPYRISRDYEMALKLAKDFGPPVLIPFPLSVYDESGESAQNAWRNVLHKSEARIKNQPLWQLPLEPIRILAAARREALRRRLRKNPSKERLWQALGWERIAPDEAIPFWERELG